MVECLYLITTYERYDSLKDLLTNILKLNHTKKIIVVDDCSTDDRYGDIINFHKDVLYYKTEQNNGKVNFWKTVNLLYQKAKEVDFKYGITLPDDVSLIENFELILNKYKGKKIIRSFTQKTAGKHNWGYEHWVDCAFISDYSFFSKLNFSIDEIVLKDDYKISSGVGKQITVRLNKLNYEVLDIGSIVSHLGNDNSKMHPKLRLEQPLYGKEFSGDIIICGLATIESRKINLEITVKSLINQVDKLYVYQNGYKKTFDFLKHPKIEIISSLDTGIDMGDAGKFYKIEKHKNCYYLSCDDDIVYPSDYTKNILSNLKKYNNKVIVTHHGRKMKNNASSYYNDVDEGFRCLDEITEEQPIDFGGTGVMGMYVNLVKDLKFDYFKSPNMGDMWVGKYAKENKIPIIILPHKKNWITNSMLLDGNDSIFGRYKDNHDTQNSVMVDVNSNKKYKVVVLTCTWQRPEITEIFVNCLLSTQKKTKSIFEYVNIVVDSENSNLNVFKHRTSDFNYHNFPNTPISNKWNYGVSLTKNIDFDYIIFLGSDDIIDQNVMLEYHNKMKDGNDFIGIMDMYVFNYLTNQLYYWDGYKKDTGRQGETIGLGRCLSKKTIEKLNYTLWAPNINKGLDKTFNNNISKLKSVKISNIRLTEFDGFACDIKGGVNITKIERYGTDLIKVNNNIILRSIPKLGTFKTDINDLSIIIPTYKNTQFLDKCFNSIIDSIGDKNVEVLVGVDSCVETFNFLVGKFYPHNFKFYFFQKNVGPYVVKNSLSKISNSNDILFFDSDDIMDKNMVGDVIDGLNGYDCVKPVYIDFNDGDIINLNSKKHIGEGVFGIKKSVFNKMNGFEPWMCAADSDFMGRLYKNRHKLKYTNKINFYRRIHKNGLTSRPDTGMSSPLRSKYAKLSKNKKDFGPLKTMVTEPYSLITGVNYLPKMDHVNEDKNLVDPNYELIIKLRKESLDKVFNHENYRVATPVEKIEKKILSINYEKINNLLNKVIPKPIPKVKQVNNTPENKKIITNKEMVKLTFPGKKNRRSGDNTMSFGEKINK